MYCASNYFVIIPLLFLTEGYAIAEKESINLNFASIDRYNPGLSNTQSGKYVPDFRGKYRHIAVPYDGGYGDRGLKYVHDVQHILEQQFNTLSLGPKDHLRFMIDFNYNGTGWQVIHFEWIRDGDETRQYNYVNENKLWDTDGQAEAPIMDYESEQNLNEDEATVTNYDAGEPQQLPKYDEENSDSNKTNIDENANENRNVNVNVGNENYGTDNYQITYSEDDGQYKTTEDPDIQAIIRAVLEHIQSNILPTLR